MQEPGDDGVYLEANARAWGSCPYLEERARAARMHERGADARA